jgi:hypothetical protein
MAQIFSCKLPQCSNIVSYTPDIIPVFKIKRITVSQKSRTRKSKLSKTVYLTCSSGHTYPYMVRG